MYVSVAANSAPEHRTARPFQVADRLLERAAMLSLLFDEAPASLAAVLAGSSLPSIALQLAARLETEIDFNAETEIDFNSYKVGSSPAACERTCGCYFQQKGSGH